MFDKAATAKKCIHVTLLFLILSYNSFKSKPELWFKHLLQFLSQHVWLTSSSNHTLLSSFIHRSGSVLRLQAERQTQRQPASSGRLQSNRVWTNLDCSGTAWLTCDKRRWSGPDLCWAGGGVSFCFRLLDWGHRPVTWRVERRAAVRGGAAKEWNYINMNSFVFPAFSM